MKDKTFPALNFLRLIAMITVFLLHTWIFTYDRFNLASLGEKVFWLKTPAWAGVWIFFILSGYLIGKGFYNEKYELSFKGIIKFYINRFCKIGIPYYIFIFVTYLLIYTNDLFDKNNILFLLKLLIFNFNGEGGKDGIGALWYISTIMQLYICAPIIYIALKKIVNAKLNGIILIFIILAGLINRTILNKLGFNWSNYIYTPFFSNLDLFVAGMMINYHIVNLSDKKRKYNNYILKTIKPISITLIVGLILYNSWIYYQGELGNIFYMYIYQIILPTVYLIIVLLYIYIFELSNSFIGDKKIYKLINKFSDISFEFYLWHSLILYLIINEINTLNNSLLNHLLVILVTLILTIVISIIFKMILITINNSKRTFIILSIVVLFSILLPALFNHVVADSRVEVNINYGFQGDASEVASGINNIDDPGLL